MNEMTQRWKVLTTERPKISGSSKGHWNCHSALYFRAILSSSLHKEKRFDYWNHEHNALCEVQLTVQSVVRSERWMHKHVREDYLKPRGQSRHPGRPFPCTDYRLPSSNTLTLSDPRAGIRCMLWLDNLNLKYYSVSTPRRSTVGLYSVMIWSVYFLNT